MAAWLIARRNLELSRQVEWAYKMQKKYVNPADL